MAEDHGTIISNLHAVAINLHKLNAALCEILNLLETTGIVDQATIDKIAQSHESGPVNDTSGKH